MSEKEMMPAPAAIIQGFEEIVLDDEDDAEELIATIKCTK
jgi:hypothetical protein